MKLSSLLAGLGLWLLSSIALANNWYQVEILVLQRPPAPTEEVFSATLQPQLPRTVAVVPGDEPTLPEQHPVAADVSALGNGAWRFLGPDHHTLAATRHTLERNGYRTLLHATWKQPVRHRGQAAPLYLEGGPTLPADLDTSSALTPDQPHALSDKTFQGTLLLHQDRMVEVEPNFWFRTADGQGGYFWTFINQKRRLKDNDVNYFDHPLYAVLLRVSP